MTHEQHYGAIIFGFFGKKEHQHKTGAELNDMVVKTLKEFRETIELENSNKVISKVKTELIKSIESINL